MFHIFQQRTVNMGWGCLHCATSALSIQFLLFLEVKQVISILEGRDLSGYGYFITSACCRSRIPGQGQNIVVTVRLLIPAKEKCDTVYQDQVNIFEGLSGSQIVSVYVFTCKQSPAIRALCKEKKSSGCKRKASLFLSLLFLSKLYFF